MNNKFFSCFTILKHTMKGMYWPSRSVFLTPGPDGGAPETEKGKDKPADNLDEKLEKSRDRLRSAKKDLYIRMKGAVVEGNLVGGMEATVKGHRKVPALDEANKTLQEAQSVLDKTPTSEEEKRTKIEENERKIAEIEQINKSLDALEYRETVRKLQATVETAGVYENSDLKDIYNGLVKSYPAIKPTGLYDDRQVGLLRENLDKGPQPKDDIKVLRRLVKDNPPDILLAKAQQEVDMAVRTEVANIKTTYPTYPIDATFGKNAEKTFLENRIKVINERSESDPFIKNLHNVTQFYFEALHRRTTHDLANSPESDENTKSYVYKESEASKKRMDARKKALAEEIKNEPNNSKNAEKQAAIDKLRTLPPDVDKLQNETLTKLGKNKKRSTKETILNDFRVDLAFIENKPKVS